MSHLRRHASASRSTATTRPPASHRGTRSAETTYRRRSVATGKNQSPFMPPETWYEPHDDQSLDFEIVVEEPGDGYSHVVTPAQIRKRLAQLPEEMLRPLEVVQLSGMTRKKKTFPCYGMQWGPALYLYPLEENRTEYFTRPPRPSERVETRMYGGRWKEDDGVWTLTWTDPSIQDYYLNNILIHELGHLLDTRNRSYTDRERYAEWFAIEYGYKPTQNERHRRLAKRKRVRRRHHAR